MYRLIKRYLASVLLVCMMLIEGMADIVDNTTIREIPPKSSKLQVNPAVTYHPDYKKLVDELSRLQKQLRTAPDSRSVAIGRQRVDAASSRLQRYIDSGKPMVLSTPKQSAGSTTQSQVDNKSTVQASSQGGGGLVDVDKRSSCYIYFYFYERIDSDGWRPTLGRNITLSSAEYALEWQGDRLFVEHTHITPRDDNGGGNEVTMLIEGELSKDSTLLKSITFKKKEVTWDKDYTGAEVFDEVTFVNIPLYSMKKEGNSNLYTYKLQGANRVKQHLQSFLKMVDGSLVSPELRWKLGSDEQVISHDQREVEIDIRIHRPIPKIKKRTTQKQLDNRGLAHTNQQVTTTQPIFLSNEMHQFYKTPVEVTYYHVVNRLFMQRGISNVGSPIITKKRVTITFVMNGKKQRLVFRETTRNHNNAKVVIQSSNHLNNKSYRLQNSQGRWGIMDQKN